MKTAVTETPAAESPAEQESWLDWLRGRDRFWFQPTDPTVLCLIRFFCGLLTLYVHLSYSFGLFDYVGRHGWGDKTVVHYFTQEAPFYAMPFNWGEPAHEIGKGFVAWSVWYHVEDPFWIVVLHGVFLAAMFAYTIGFCTRISGVLTWIGTLSYINRLPFMTFGMDVIMVIVQTYLLIGPSGALFSVDHWLQKRRSVGGATSARPGQPAEIGFGEPGDPSDADSLLLRVSGDGPGEAARPKLVERRRGLWHDWQSEFLALAIVAIS